MSDPTPNAALRVLVVDDNRDAADSLAILLDLWGHQARLSYDGHSGLRAGLAFRPHVALLDVMMPGLSGPEVARRLRQEPGLERAVLVALTATEPDDPRLSGRLGAFDHYLKKPYSLEALERILAGCAARTPA
jgi:CheY-like chemotaxis protein